MNLPTNLQIREAAMKQQAFYLGFITNPKNG